MFHVSSLTIMQKVTKKVALKNLTISFSKYNFLLNAPTTRTKVDAIYIEE